MPFPEDSFDVVWMQNVGMNIADKRKLYQEIYRVLRPGGRFAFQEIVGGDSPTTYFPLPWTTNPAEQFLVSLEETRELLTEAGLVTDYFEDVGHAPLPEPASGAPDAIAQAPLSLSVYVDNPAQKAENASRSIKECQIRLVRGVFRVE